MAPALDLNAAYAIRAHAGIRLGAARENTAIIAAGVRGAKCFTWGTICTDGICKPTTCTGEGCYRGTSYSPRGQPSMEDCINLREPVLCTKVVRETTRGPSSVSKTTTTECRTATACLVRPTNEPVTTTTATVDKRSYHTRDKGFKVPQARSDHLESFSSKLEAMHKTLSTAMYHTPKPTSKPKPKPKPRPAATSRPRPKQPKATDFHCKGSLVCGLPIMSGSVREDCELLKKNLRDAHGGNRDDGGVVFGHGPEALHGGFCTGGCGIFIEGKNRKEEGCEYPAGVLVE